MKTSASSALSQILAVKNNELTNKELVQILYKGVKDMAQARQDIVQDNEDKEVLNDAIECFELTDDIYEQSLHILTMQTVLFEHLHQYSKLLENVLGKLGFEKIKYS